MDVKEVQVALNRLIEESTKLQGRLLVWTVTDDDDRDAVRHDIQTLNGYMYDLVSAARK